MRDKEGGGKRVYGEREREREKEREREREGGREGHVAMQTARQ